MGRTSKFSFPMPGRKHATTKEEVPVKSPMSPRGSGLSKAQRILGTESDLNIDLHSPTRDDHPWMQPGSRSSGMSISISESTQSIHEGASVHEYQNEQWDRESGVLPRNTPRYGKASSNSLGQRNVDDGTTSISSRLRNEDSSSTLKSYYDKQKSPLAISQQTSASSARDLALRKGFPPVISRSPLLQVESALDPFDEQFSAKAKYAERKEDPVENSSKKKPARLDLSMLFPRSKRHGLLTPSPSSTSTNASRDTTNSESGRRKLKKTSSKESMQSQHHSIRSTKSNEPYRGQTKSTSNSVSNHYENVPARSPRMDRIPESHALDTGLKGDHNGIKPTLSRDPYLVSSESQSFSWRNVRASLVSPPWESSSAASISSRNTKTSRHTNSSILSSSDLQEKSVLSLSSDSEEDERSDREASGLTKPVNQDDRRKSEKARESSTPDRDHGHHSSQQPGGLTARSQNRKASGNKETAFLEVPSRSSHPRMSAAWSYSETEMANAPIPPREHRRASSKGKKASRTSSAMQPEISSLQPTPPLSPSSVEFRQVSDRSSRFMAVTKQEEALLEALRQKRARMREKIIEEHEIAKSPSPPRIPQRSASRGAALHSRQSTNSSVNTMQSASNGKHNGSSKVLLYLDAPAADAQYIDAAEPSPDLSDLGDFLTYRGSDEDSTPRVSWQPTERPRPDSYVAPQHKFDNHSPRTPPSVAARLSAVGVGAYRNDSQPSQALASKKRNTGVKFLDHESRLVNTQDFFLDEDENEGLRRL